MICSASARLTEPAAPWCATSNGSTPSPVKIRAALPSAESAIVPSDSSPVLPARKLAANCGNCHNDTPDRVPQVDLSLWLETDLSAVIDSAAWRTAVDEPSTLFNDQHVSGRIVPGDPDASAVLYRMGQRGNPAQMPPLASAVVDEDGLAVVRAWIESLP